MLLVSKKTVLMSTSTLAIAVFSGLTSAHCIQNQTITTVSANAQQYDTYLVSCGAGTTHLDAWVNENAGTAADPIKLEIGKDEAASGTVQDTSNTASTCPAVNPPAGWSPAASLFKNTGIYTIVVSKDSTATKTYDMTFHCRDGAVAGAGNETPTSGVLAGGLFGNDIDRIMNH